MWNRIIIIICSVFVLTGPASSGDMTHIPDRDFDKLAYENKNPTGIWSDGTTMWVVNRYAKIYAYNMRTRAHDRGRDFNTLKAAGNESPAGIWSDGTIMWVADYGGHIYAYGGQVGSSDQAIQDFSMKIKGTTGTLKICVRDHECEDGDRISVDVDGRTIFSGEIDNDWDCYTLTVWSGESYAVELTAINGTGYKGDCSYRDENTGEIRVTGENTETQVWRHRGGAGSKARIIVERAW